jgi:hypothetical protein
MRDVICDLQSAMSGMQCAGVRPWDAVPSCKTYPCQHTSQSCGPFPQDTKPLQPYPYARDTGPLPLPTHILTPEIANTMCTAMAE